MRVERNDADIVEDSNHPSGSHEQEEVRTAAMAARVCGWRRVDPTTLPGVDHEINYHDRRLPGHNMIPRYSKNL